LKKTLSRESTNHQISSIITRGVSFQIEWEPTIPIQSYLDVVQRNRSWVKETWGISPWFLGLSDREQGN
jgi:hypothetical protein